MPVIACPGCGKQYKIAAAAAGQVAKCVCGKRFRLGGSPSPQSSAAQSTAPKSAPAKTTAPSAQATAVLPQPKHATVKASAPAVAARSAPKAKDDFWADSIAIADAPKKPAAEPATATSTAKGLTGSPAAGASKSKSTAPTNKKKSDAPKVRWGFDWGKVVAGLGAFLIFGGITAALAASTGRISIYLAVLAVGGLFTMLSGLMGEEGIW